MVFIFLMLYDTASFFSDVAWIMGSDVLVY